MDVDVVADLHQSEAFLKINPNGRIPAIIDDNAGGKNVFESASILLWLASQYGAFPSAIT
jgi:glutathione S-transferase